MPRLATGRGVKAHRSYTVEEAARVCRVCRATVRHWIKDGLPAIQIGKGFLILGRDLQAYLDARRKARRYTLGPGEFYCLPCRAPRKAAGGFAEFQPARCGAGTLVAICDTCERIVCRKVSAARLDGVASGLDVTVKPLAAQASDTTPGAPLPPHGPAPKVATGDTRQGSRCPSVPSLNGEV
ncbi:MAG: helix-turn-helix domain-containing protein [Pseudomonadota bacterium]